MCRLALCIVAATVLFCGFSQRGEAAATNKTSTTARAICVVFGHYCGQALRVAKCESGLSMYARNGQYLGLFQMGDYARSRYGHSYTNVWVQVVAAYRYFVDSGYDWSPWECKP